MDDPRPTIISARPREIRSIVAKFWNTRTGSSALKHGDGARQTDPLGACGCRSEKDCRRGIEELAAMVFADTKRVHPHLRGVFDLLEELSQTVRRIHGTAVLVERGGETVNADLRRSPIRRRSIGPG